jgi:hypothetical protein
MTLDEFIIRLEKTPRDWQLRTFTVSNGKRQKAIRRGLREKHCPISALTMSDTWAAFLVASTIGLARDLAIDIVNASDENPGYDSQLRDRLLKACGIQ